MSKKPSPASEPAKLHSYVVRFAGDTPPPVTVQAESFEFDADALTFSQGNAMVAVVRGSWVSVIQNPDPEVPPA